MTSIFPESAIEALRSAYPDGIARLTHNLVGHPLLQLDALVDCARRMNPADLEHNAAVDLPMGVSNDDIRSNNLSVEDTIAQIDRCGSWVLLKKAQQVPEYGALLDQALAEIAPVVLPRTGAQMRPDAYIFISSPDAITPLHFDPDYNILVQLTGSKTMILFDAEDDEIATQDFHERYFAGGKRNLPWEERFARRGRSYDLHPGEALHVPILAPHWVKVHAGSHSISLSLTWRSVWSHHHADAHRLNRRLRGVGLKPKAPKLYPGSNKAKSLAYRALQRVDRLTGRGNA